MREEQNLGDDRPTIIDWLGLRRQPDYSKAKWLGGLISVFVILVILVLVGLTAFQFLKAVAGLSEFADAEVQSSAIRNSGLVLAAVIGVPFLVWRTLVAQKQADTATEALFNDKINVAAEDLHARRLVTNNPNDKEAKNRWDYHQDDIIKRNAAIDRLEGLAIERPDIAPRIARMLSIYVRELTREHTPHEPAKDASLIGLRKWANGLKACRSDMENAVKTLGRLQEIKGIEPKEISIDLRDANLQGFDLQNASLLNARLNRTKMQGADLRWAKMREADISGAEMEGANLSGAEMSTDNLLMAQNQGAVLSFAQERNVFDLEAYHAYAAEEYDAQAAEQEY